MCHFLHIVLSLQFNLLFRLYYLFTYIHRQVPNIYRRVLSKISLQFVKTELATTTVTEKFAERSGGYVPMELVIKGLLFNALSLEYPSMEKLFLLLTDSNWMMNTSFYILSINSVRHTILNMASYAFSSFLFHLFLEGFFFFLFFGFLFI